MSFKPLPTDRGPRIDAEPLFEWEFKEVWNFNTAPERVIPGDAAQISGSFLHDYGAAGWELVSVCAYMYQPPGADYPELYKVAYLKRCKQIRPLRVEDRVDLEYPR